jgi:hypothetical protein
MKSKGNTSPTRNAGPAALWLRSGTLLALLAISSVASTDQARGTIGVSANVQPMARLSLAGSEPDLFLTAQDLERGYINSPRPLRLTVYSNSRSGYALDVMPVTGLFSSLAVEGLGSDVVLSAEGGTVTQRWARPQTVSLELKFSFTLAKGLEPGLYPWPVRLAARPLGTSD